MQLPESDKAPWRWSGGSTVAIEHATSQFSIAIPGAPIVERAGSTFGDVQWDVYIVTRVPHNVTIRLRHLAMPADNPSALLEFLGGKRAPTGKLVASPQPPWDPAWGVDAVASGTIEMTLPRMGGGGPGVKRSDDMLVLARRATTGGGIVLVEIAAGERAAPSIGAFLHEVHATIRWGSTAPLVTPPAGSPFLADGALPKLRVESLREVADLTPRLAAESPDLRAALLATWEPMLRFEVRVPWAQQLQAPTLPPAYPAWIRDRLAQHATYVRTARDLYGLLWIWVRSLRAAGARDDSSYFAAPGPLELRPEREAELDAFAGELVRAGLTAADNREIAMWLRAFAIGADAPTDPMIPPLVDMLVRGAEMKTSNPLAIARLGEHLRGLRVMGDLQAMAVYWCAALERVVALSPT